jgi:endonuclease/exonuclease/phosphatase family metal-dependent hydrolase
MTKALLVLSMLLAVFMPGVIRGETTVDVMTFNIRYGTANDGPNHWDLRRDLVADVIARHDPDVVGLQECLEFQAEYIVERLPQYRYVGVGRNRDGGGEMNAILYKHDTLVPLEVENTWFAENPEEPGGNWHDSAFPRIATRVRLWHRTDERSVSVINTHFDHVGEIARRESAKFIALRAGYLPDSEPIVVMGDFNSIAEKSEAWTIMIEGGLKDAWLVAPLRRGPAATFGAWKPVDPQSDRRIDWILFRGPVHPESIVAIEDNVDGRFPSDHLPVQARLILED